MDDPYSENGMPPDVSILLCAHNEEATIEHTLISLRAQETVARIEIVGVDNGSTDSTGSILRTFADCDLICEERGKVPCIRKGLRHVRGGIVAFADADTVYPKVWVDEAFLPFSMDDKLLLVFGPSETSVRPQYLARLISRIFAWLSMRCGVCTCTGFNMAVRRDALGEVVGDIGNPALSGWAIGTALLRAHGRHRIAFNTRMAAPKNMRRIKKQGWVVWLLMLASEWMRLAMGRNLDVAESEYYEF